MLIWAPPGPRPDLVGAIRFPSLPLTPARPSDPPGLCNPGLPRLLLSPPLTLRTKKPARASSTAAMLGDQADLLRPAIGSRFLDGWVSHGAELTLDEVERIRI